MLCITHVPKLTGCLIFLHIFLFIVVVSFAFPVFYSFFYRSKYCRFTFYRWNVCAVLCVCHSSDNTVDVVYLSIYRIFITMYICVKNNKKKKRRRNHWNLYMLLLNGEFHAFLLIHFHDLHLKSDNKWAICI